jgi:hypothetical protein
MRIGSSFALSAVVALCACGGSSGGGGGSTCNPGATAAFTVSGTGISPTAVCVLPSGTVSFNNTSATARTFASGDCPELNNLAVAASATTPVLFGATQKTCTFHDAANASNAAFQGTVAVTSAPAQGPGY